MAVLTNPDSPYTALFLKNAAMEAQSVGVELQILQARNPGEFDAAFAAMRSGNAQALSRQIARVFLFDGVCRLGGRGRLPWLHSGRLVHQARWVQSCVSQPAAPSMTASSARTMVALLIMMCSLALYSGPTPVGIVLLHVRSCKRFADCAPTNLKFAPRNSKRRRNTRRSARSSRPTKQMRARRGWWVPGGE